VNNQDQLTRAIALAFAAVEVMRQNASPRNILRIVEKLELEARQSADEAGESEGLEMAISRAKLWLTT
jgi:hypothetical protein